MPALAVASLTPEITGMSGMSVGASGETADDMDTSGFEAKEALLITSPGLRGEVDFRAKRESPVRGSHRLWSSRREPSSGSQDPRHLLPASGEQERRPSYFFAGAVLVSAGFVGAVFVRFFSFFSRLSFP